MRNKCDIEKDIKATEILLEAYKEELEQIPSTFKGGQWFRDKHGLMILAQVDSEKYGLIYVNDNGNRSADPYEVKNPIAITWDEIKIMASNNWAGQPEPITITIKVNQ